MFFNRHKKMKKLILKQLFCATITALLLGGCHKKDDPKAITCLLTSQVTAGSGNTYTYTFTYDGQQATTTSTTTAFAAGGGGSITGTFKYDGSGNISEIDYSGGARDVFTYSNGVITKKEKYSNTNALEDQTDYDYVNGQLVKIQEYYKNGLTLAKEAYQVLEYPTPSSKDPIRIKHFDTASSTTPSSTSEFSYGDQKCAFSAAPPALVKYLRLGGQPVENNVTKIVFSGGEVITYTYEFNANGYPSTRIETYTVSSQVNTNTYSYACS